MIKLIGNVTIAVVLVYGGYRVMGGQVEVGVLAAFLLYLRRFFEPMQELSMFYNSLQSATAALEKLSGVLEETSTVAEPTQPRAAASERVETSTSTTCGSPTKRRSSCPTSTCTFPLGRPWPWSGLPVPARRPSRGWSRAFTTHWRATFVSTASTSAILPRRTCAGRLSWSPRRTSSSPTPWPSNIRFGRPSASDQAVEDAARAIGAHDFIAALPDGYDTDVGKRGGRLSAGQRQLVAFARAFLADPAVLILDEATSSLDIPSERLVQRALRTILADRTAIIIAHRLSTVEIADRVVVLEAGRIKESGSPAELLHTEGSYAGLQQAWLDSLV